jgi:hypothetical protein
MIRDLAEHLRAAFDASQFPLCRRVARRELAAID